MARTAAANTVTAESFHLVDYEHAEALTLKATRDGFGEGLVEAGRRDQRVIGICADLAESTRMEHFKFAFPQRYIEIGVAEQMLAAMASGLAASGKIPFIASYAMFDPGRSWEQIRTTIALNEVNVKIAGAHAGVSVGPDGATHQAIEDIAIMRVIPKMTVVVPCDAVQTKKATIAAAQWQGPVYLRFGRDKTAIVTSEETPFAIGTAQEFRSGDDVAIVACGILVCNALSAAEALAKEDGLECRVINNHTVKPMDETAIVGAARTCGAIVTVEEHQVAGGMGSGVAEILARTHPVPVEFIGVQDQFGQSGEPAELLEHYGMGVDAIKTAVRKVVDRKAAAST
jgi:transketolase